MEEQKKTKNIGLALLALIGVPFIVTLFKFFQKGPDEPVTMRDLLAVFGMQLLFATGLLIYILFFLHASAVLG